MSRAKHVAWSSPDEWNQLTDHTGMPEPLDSDERLVRYIAGECSPFEAARIQRWIAANPARWERFQALERVWRASGVGPARLWSVDTAWAMLRESRRPVDARRGQRGRSIVHLVRLPRRRSAR